MGDSRGIMKVNFIARKKRRGNMETGAQRERGSSGEVEKETGRRERRCQKRKVRGGGVSKDREGRQDERPRKQTLGPCAGNYHLW